MIFWHSVSGVIYYVVFSFHRLLFQQHVFWQYSIISKSVNYIATLDIIVTYIKENIITKLQKLYSLPRNSRAGSKSPVLFVKSLFPWAIYRPRAKYSLKGLQYIKETCSYHHTFFFFMCDDLSFITTTQKTLKPSKNLLIPRMDEKKMSYPGISAEGYQQKHKMQVASKKVYWKNNRVFQALVTYCH